MQKTFCISVLVNNITTVGIEKYELLWVNCKFFVGMFALSFGLRAWISKDLRIAICHFQWHRDCEILPDKYVLSTMGVSKESISKFLIENRFHVKLRILSPENCKQSLQVKSWKVEVTAEKKQTQDYNQNFVMQAHKSSMYFPRWV